MYAVGRTGRPGNRGLQMDIFIAKCDTSISVAWEKLSPAVQQYVISYGLTQTLNDANANVSTSKEVDGKRVALEGAELDVARREAMGLTQKRLDNLLAGKVPAGGGGKRLDFVEQAKRAWFSTQFRQAGLKAVDADVAAKEPLSVALANLVALKFKAAKGRDATPEEVAERVGQNEQAVSDKIAKDAKKLAEAAKAAQKAEVEVAI